MCVTLHFNFWQMKWIFVLFTWIDCAYFFFFTYVESLTLTHWVPSRGWLIEPFLFTIFTKIPPYGCIERR
jgi:hypothetical protein